ncbi:MAG TPA: HIT domain-containing protein [Salinivirgaceae bacterium]|nr:HIT domain-containing protein [Salinivirgaceae bacterium]
MIDCPFCRLASSGTYFYENRYFFAAYNISPILPGHSLVIPKRHVVRLADLSETETHEAMPFVINVNRILSELFKTQDFDISIQDGTAAGQTVMHLHIHIIPRILDDLPNAGDWYDLLYNDDKRMIDSELRPKLSNEKLNAITLKLKDVSQKLFND